MSNYTLMMIDQTCIVEFQARASSEELMDKANRNYVGLYNEEENWDTPIRTNVGKKLAKYFYDTLFQTNSPVFYQKSSI